MAESHQHGLLWTLSKINGKWDSDLKFLAPNTQKRKTVRSHIYLGENFLLKN